MPRCKSREFWGHIPDLSLLNDHVLTASFAINHDAGPGRSSGRQGFDAFEPMWAPEQMFE
jgi:hypothetical protein